MATGDEARKVIFAYDDFKEIVLDIFHERLQRNARYSLRAFARDLDMRGSRLSEVLNSRYGLSPTEARRVAKRLELTDSEVEYFCNLVAGKHARSRAERKVAEMKLAQIRSEREYAIVTNGALEALSKWYYLPLIELIQIQGGEGSPELYAKALKISTSEVTSAIRTLLTVGVLVQVDGVLKKSERYMEIKSETPAAQVREFHKRILERAISAIDEQGMDKRKTISTIFTLRFEDVKSAREALDQLSDKFIGRFENESDANSVYCLNLNLFEVARATE